MVVFGGMIALQSSQGLDATKIVYLLGTALSFAGAVVAIWYARGGVAVRSAIAWLVASGTLVTLLAVSFVIARVNGTTTVDWLRDIASYALFASVPVFALDGQASASRRLLIAMLVVAGSLGGLSWAIEWLNRREILELPLSRLLFPSPQIPTVLYLFAMAFAIRAGPAGWRWAVLAGVILGFFLVTGTRSSLLILLGPVVMAAIAGRTRVPAAVGSGVVHVVVAIAVVVAFQIAVTLSSDGAAQITSPPDGGTGAVATATPGPGVIGDRFGGLGAVISNPGADPSLKERVAQYEAAWRLFASAPLFGVGPGHAIEWIRVSGEKWNAFTADTPLVLLAKFGLLGALAMLPLFWAYADTLRKLRPRAGQSVAGLAMVGYATTTIVALPLGFPIEDKGTSLGLILLLALAFGELSQQSEPDSPSPVDVASGVAR